MRFNELAFEPPIHAIRVVSCGKNGVGDTDITLTEDKIRGFRLDGDGVRVYRWERDVRGYYDNVFVPYSNLKAIVFYFEDGSEYMSDLINRQDAIDALEKIDWYHQNKNKDMVQGANSAEHQAWYKEQDVFEAIEQLPSAQPEIKPISYMDCANAMLMMWMDKIITDGEYNRIMDRLNAKHKLEVEHERTD